ncbi:MAG: hypothetical protein KDA87_11895 [Planctomycetales bacterium]|nr:hypothetical protein [Planctomycetales bacterium]
MDHSSAQFDSKSGVRGAIFKLVLVISVVCVSTLIGFVIIISLPLMRLARDIRAAQHQIVNEFDHISIRDAARSILADPTDRDIDLCDLPNSIAKTEPKSVYVRHGAMYIEYGGGFAHYGLIIDPSDRPVASDGNDAGGEFYYREKKLIADVYFYDSE